RGQLATRERAHLLDRVQNDRWANSAVQSDHIGAPFVELRRENFRGRAEGSVAVDLNRDLRNDWQIAKLAHRPDRLLQFRNVRESFEHEEIDAAFEQS